MMNLPTIKPSSISPPSIYTGFRARITGYQPPAFSSFKDFKIRKGERELTRSEHSSLFKGDNLNPVQQPTATGLKNETPVPLDRESYKQLRGKSSLRNKELRAALPEGTHRLVRKYGDPSFLESLARENLAEYRYKKWDEYHAAVAENNRIRAERRQQWTEHYARRRERIAALMSQI